MNKNIIKLLAVLVMCFMIGAVLVACGAQGEQGEQGEQGAPGATGEQGPQGPAGLTPYIGENGNWWVGDEDTGVKAAGDDADSLRCEEHHWDKYEIVVVPHTATSIGVVLKVCVDCDGAEFVEVGHELVKGETFEPTCDEDGYGYTVYTCACGYTEQGDIVPAVDCIAGDKEYSKNEAGICDCIFGKPWIKFCTMCGEKLEEGNDVAAEDRQHNWPEEAYHPIKDEEGIFNPCTWPGGEIAECTNCECKCVSEIIYNDPASAPDHTWSNWSVKSSENGTYTLERTCSVCSAKFAEGTETKVITLADCDKKTTAPKCEEAGKHEYTYTINGQTLPIYTETIPATGHTVDETCTYTVDVLPSATAEGKISTKCATCGAALEMALPEINEVNIMRGMYTVMHGECDDNYDYYGIALTDKNGAINGVIGVDFKLDANYGHNNNLYGEGADWVVIDINGTLYDAYWCTTCDHWIAVKEHVEA